MAWDNLQSFDGDKKFQWAFYLNRKYLEPVGVWPSDNKKESALRPLRPTFMLIVVLICYSYPTVYALIKVRHELSLTVDCMLTSISSFTSGFKLFSLWYYHPVYRSLIKWAKIDWCERVEDWERKLMFKQARRGRLLTAISYSTMFVHVNAFFFAPVFDLRIRLVSNITDPDPNRLLPAAAYYPYEHHKSPYYELTYLSQVIAITFFSSAYSALDNFFNALAFHASGQSEILTERMRRLCDTDRTSVRQRIRELIQFHNHLARFVKALEESFNIVILVHIFGSMLMICSVSYGCIKAFDGAPPAIQVILFVASIFNLNEHIFVYCLTSEILASNSSEIFDGVYNCLWYNLPAKEAKYLTLIMLRSQYPLRISAGKLFHLSLNSYIQIVKSTAGYISMLLTVS